MSMKIEGLDKVERMLKRLPRRNQRKIKITAAAKGARVISNRIKQNVRAIPEATLTASGRERFAKSIAVRKTIKTETNSWVQIGPRYRGGKNQFPEAHLFEFGTTMRSKKKGGSTGRIAPTGVIRKAWDETKRQAVQSASEHLLSETLKEAEKLLR